MVKSKTSGLIEDPSASTRGVIAFFIAAALGMAFIVLAKLSALGQFAVTAVPIGILFVYAYLLFRWRRVTLRDDQAGDNLYYLGFLYTLTSIAVSLYQFSLAESAQEQIITNFGIAIATTIVGLALRVMFNQMRQDPAEVERVSRAELAEASRRLRREIDTVVMELNVFQRTNQQSVVDNQRTLQERIAETLNTSSTAFAASVVELNERVSSLTRSMASADDALDDFEQGLEALRTPELLVEIKSLIDEVRNARADQADRLNAAAVAMDMAAGTIRDSSKTIAEAAKLRSRSPSGGELHRLWVRAVDWLGRRTQN
jgi:exonuclease VII small subunit